MYFERKAYLKELISAEGNGMIKIITGIRRFPLGEELDCLEENVKGGRITGVNRVNSCFSALSSSILYRIFMPRRALSIFPGYLPLQSHLANRHESCFSQPCHPAGRWWSSRILSCCRESPSCGGSRWCGRRRW